jgi:ELWxxDGT repeat protein
VNGRLYYACDDGTGKGEELCTSDGTDAGTFVVADINPGSASSFRRDNERSAGVGVGNAYIFRAVVTTNGVTRDQLWTSSGCARNTFELLKIQSDSNINARTFRASPQGGKAFFFASGVGPQDDELWVTDGTPQGTDVAVDACPTVGRGGAVGADDMGFLGSKVFFSASAQGGGNNNQLWEFDANTKQGKQTAVLSSATASNPDFFARGFAQVGTSHLMFVANDGTARLNRIWKTDGTATGTQRVSSSVDGIVPPLVASGFSRDRVYFQARDNTYGHELHMATLNSAQLVKDLILGDVDGWAEEITDMGSYVLFSGDKELFRSDGTMQGTTLVKDINQGAPSTASPGQSYPRNFARIGDKMVFSGENGVNGRELWISDGTPAGTVMLADINPGAPSSSPQDFTVVGAYVYFSAETATAGRELWRVLLNPGASTPVPPISCPAAQQSGGTWTPANAVGACCMPNACMSTTAAACTGTYSGVGTSCSSSCGSTAPTSGACCKMASSQCWPNQPKGNCDFLGGFLRDGTDCSVCWSSPATPAPPGAPMPPADARGNCCAKDSCYQQHTAQSCAAVAAGAKFIGAEQCGKCFEQTPSQIDPNCSQQAKDFCNLVCGGQLASCSCQGTTIKPTCNAGNTPTAAPTTPPGTPFPVPVPGGPPATGVYVPVTQPNGQPATQPNGLTITNAVVPATQPGGAPSPGNTVVVVPVTDAAGNVIGTATKPSGQPNNGGFTTQPNNGPGNTNGNCVVLPSWCEMVCGANPVAACTCDGVSCGKAGADSGATDNNAHLATTIVMVTSMMTMMW